MIERTAPAHPHGFDVVLLIDEQHDKPALAPQTLKHCCTQALQQQSLLDLSQADTVEISIQSLDMDAMRALNFEYRKKDSATNVLSFESGLPLLQELDAPNLQVLGDLILCPELIAREAYEQDKPVADHWAHLVVHGTLHLCGYDHISDDDASLMESLEVQVLSTCSIPDPYQMHAVK